jgi:peptidoglycan/LPS O-acetylase OafA/YrhL
MTLAPFSAENRGMEVTAHRIRYIDGLRAVAVLLVVAHHVMLHSPALPASIPFASWAHVMLEGAHGVDLFFVLSGFCLSYPVLQRLRTEHAARFSITRYFARRILRIVPPYYAAIALLLLLPATHTAVSASDVVKQLLFLDWHTTFLNGSFWTLCVELRWYFIFPLALALWIERPRAFWALASATAILYGMTRMHAPDVGTLLPFMLGIVAADLEIRAVAVERYALALLPLFILCALVLERTISMPSPSGTEYSLFFVQTNPGWQLAAFAFVLLSARIRLLRALLSTPPLVAAGVASYSIYLVHEPIVTQLQNRLHLPLVQGMIVSYAAAVLAGFAFWTVFERLWMAGPLKTRAAALLEPIVERAAETLQIPLQLAFWEAGAVTRIASSAPEQESAPA